MTEEYLISIFDSVTFDLFPVMKESPLCSKVSCVIKHLFTGVFTWELFQFLMQYHCGLLPAC